MLPDVHQILKQYWGFDAFRPLQEDIVNHVLAGKDTLALLPTGGGKSICFQVPALALDGICLVVSPLIALMKDQVENLNKRGIAAMHIASTLKREEVENAMQAAVNKKIKFLYLSPERLQSAKFIDYLKYIPVTLIAVDEAHCISQWGYDFRPSYLKIADLRPLFPKVPIIALTATATPEVVKDIAENLQFSDHQLFQKSFERSNLHYIVQWEENKVKRLLNILKNVPGTSVVYVRNRKRTQELAEILRKNQIEAWPYHAGLDSMTRQLRQKRWVENKLRVMVCTNAFGMGIDKPDVRSVIHMDIPDSVEAYFQEAGRAGRDEKLSYAVLLVDQQDVSESLYKLESRLPEFDLVKAVYNWLGNYFNIAVGSGEGVSYNFQMLDFCKQFQVNPVHCHSAIGFIEKEGLIQYVDNNYSPSRILITADREAFYQFELNNPKIEKLIKVLLRSYTGLFQDFVAINLKDIATRLNSDEQSIDKALVYMRNSGVIHYFPQNNLPQLYFPIARQHPDRLPLSRKKYEWLCENIKARMKAMIGFIEDEKTCRSVHLLAYFGEKKAEKCGVCDVCLTEKKKSKLNTHLSNKSKELLNLLNEKPHDLDEMMNVMKISIDDLQDLLHFLEDSHQIISQPDQTWKLKI